MTFISVRFVVFFIVTAVLYFSLPFRYRWALLLVASYFFYRLSVIYRGAIGTYLHGSLLPKNPGVADFLIEKALARREQGVRLDPLDDVLELKAHDAAVARARKTH